MERLGEMKPYGAIHKGRPKREGGEGFEKIGLLDTKRGGGEDLIKLDVRSFISFFCEYKSRNWNFLFFS